MVAAHVWTVMLVDNVVNVISGTLVTLIAKNVNVRLNNIQKKPFVIMLMEHAIVWKSSTELSVRVAEYYKYPDCEPCDCNTDNTVDESNVCGKEDGQCPCDREDKLTGIKCDACKLGYLLSNGINYCKIGYKYFDLCNGGNCNCYEEFEKPKDCEYCERGYFDFFSNGTCQGKTSNS